MLWFDPAFAGQASAANEPMRKLLFFSCINLMHYCSTLSWLAVFLVFRLFMFNPFRVGGIFSFQVIHVQPFQGCVFLWKLMYPGCCPGL